MNHCISLACGIAAILALGSIANAAATGAARVNFCGRVVPLVENGCIGVNSGTLYDITGAQPKPPVGAKIKGSGVPDGAMTTCQQGTHLASIVWHRVLFCPMPPH